MPEGDTIFRSAERLGAALVGESLQRIEAPRWSGRVPVVGEQVDAVEAVGKHLQIRFSGGLVLSTHMRMTGSWHLYRPGERWRKARSSMRVALVTERWEAVCFLAPEVRFSVAPASLADGSVPVIEALRHLGPDLCRPDADVAECVRRFGLVDGTLTIAEALLDQRVCCGVGNVYKSEVCWAAVMDPFTPVGEVSGSERRRLVELASTQLRANLGSSRRTTAPGGLAVYGRTGRPCRRCAAPILAGDESTARAVECA